MRCFGFSLPLLVALPALVLSVACTGKEDDSDSGRPRPDQDADTDSDTDTDTDTDSDTDTDTDPNDLSSYQEFVRTQADTVCTLWETCGYLDDVGYADVDACKTDVIANLGVDPCVDYDAQAARVCIQTETTASADCTTYDGSIPQACGEVCPRPPQDDTATTTSMFESWTPKALPKRTVAKPDAASHQ